MLAPASRNKTSPLGRDWEGAETRPDERFDGGFRERSRRVSIPPSDRGATERLGKAAVPLPERREQLRNGGVAQRAPSALRRTRLSVRSLVQDPCPTEHARMLSKGLGL